MADGVVTNLIGGSSIHELLSLEPYGCQRRLWYRDRGQIPDYPEANQGALERGRWGEAAAAKVYAQQTGRKLRHVYSQMVSRECPDFGGHIDRHIVAINQFPYFGPGVLEVKCPGEYEFRRIKRAGLHQASIAQLQWYLNLTGWHWGAFAVFSLERWELVHFDIARDNVLIAQLVEEAHRYRRIRENGPPPERLDPQDKRCAQCVYRTTCQGEALLALVGQDGDAPEVDLGIAPLVTAYQDAQQLVAEAETQAAADRQALETALGDRQAVQTAGAKVYWRAQPGAWRWDTKTLETEHPELALTYKRQGAPTRPLRIFPI